jgi:hypothetical protein
LQRTYRERDGLQSGTLKTADGHRSSISIRAYRQMPGLRGPQAQNECRNRLRFSNESHCDGHSARTK